LNKLACKEVMDTLSPAESVEEELCEPLGIITDDDWVFVTSSKVVRGTEMDIFWADKSNGIT